VNVACNTAARKSEIDKESNQKLESTNPSKKNKTVRLLATPTILSDVVCLKSDEDGAAYSLQCMGGFKW